MMVDEKIFPTKAEIEFGNVLIRIFGIESIPSTIGFFPELCEYIRDHLDQCTNIPARQKKDPKSKAEILMPLTPMKLTGCVGFSEERGYIYLSQCPSCKNIRLNTTSKTPLCSCVNNPFLWVDKSSGNVERESTGKDWDWFDKSVAELDKFLVGEIKNPTLSEIDTSDITKMCRITQRLREIIKSGDE